MKKIIFLLTVALILSFAGGVHVYAQEYILKLREKPYDESAVRRMSLPDIHIADEDENLYLADSYEAAKPYIDAGLTEYAEPNYELKLFYTVDERCYDDLWNINMINVPYFWNTGCFGNEIKVAVIDTGTYPHRDIAPNLLDGYNYFNNTTDTTDVISHGTFVSGMIAAVPNTAGMTGTAPRVKIVPLKCFNDETKKADSIDIARAVRDAVDTYDCKILNLSCGMAVSSYTLEQAVSYAVSKGAIVISAVGNDGDSALQYPAAYDNVIGVGSVDSTKRVSYFSQRNNSVFVTAPGAGLRGLALSESSYRLGQGTSYAAPIVSAIAALACGIDDTIDSEGFMNILKNTSDDLGDTGYDISYGYGLVNAKNIVDYMLDGKDCFVSKADTEENGESSVTVYNNTTGMLKLWSVWSSYDKNETELLDVKRTGLILQPKSSAIINTAFAREGLKHILWYAETMNPAYECQSVNR